MQRFSTRGPHTACHESNAARMLQYYVLNIIQKALSVLQLVIVLHSFKNVL